MSAHVVGLDKVSRKLRAIGTVLQQPMKGLLRREGRLIAVSLARSTQPFGNDSTALKHGRDAVARDIKRVYLRPRDAYKDLIGSTRAIHDRFDALLRVKTKYDPNEYAAAFWKAYKEGDIALAQAILKAHGRTLSGAVFGPFDGGAAHKAARDPQTGRVKSRANSGRVIIVDPRGLDAYIAKRQDNVGTGKGAWADVANSLGGIRGAGEGADVSASWFTHQGRGKGRVAWDGTADSPIITITSTLSYADQILSPADRSSAVKIAHNRLIKSLQIAASAAMKKLPTAA